MLLKGFAGSAEVAEDAEVAIEAVAEDVGRGDENFVALSPTIDPPWADGEVKGSSSVEGLRSVEGEDNEPARRVDLNLIKATI